MLRHWKRSDWLLVPALIVFVGFWSVVLSGALPAPPQQRKQPVSISDAECTTHECRQEANETALTDYTGKLAWFTGVLAFVSIMQGIFLWRADSTSRIAANAAREIGERQLNLTGLQADILEKQKEIDRLKYFAEFRPKLEIKFIKILDFSSQTPPDSQPVRGQFVVINTGTGEAVVIGSKVSFEWYYPADIPVPADLEGTDLIPTRRFGVGATDTVQVTTNDLGGAHMAYDDGIMRLYLLGWVVYADGRGEEFGHKRTTYFCREYHPTTKQFEVARDFPDWEFTH